MSKQRPRDGPALQVGFLRGWGPDPYHASRQPMMNLNLQRSASKRSLSQPTLFCTHLSAQVLTCSASSVHRSCHSAASANYTNCSRRCLSACCWSQYQLCLVVQVKACLHVNLYAELGQVPTMEGPLARPSTGGLYLSALAWVGYGTSGTLSPQKLESQRFVGGC